MLFVPFLYSRLLCGCPSAVDARVACCKFSHYLTSYCDFTTAQPLCPVIFQLFSSYLPCKIIEPVGGLPGGTFSLSTVPEAPSTQRIGGSAGNPWGGGAARQRPFASSCRVESVLLLPVIIGIAVPAERSLLPVAAGLLDSGCSALLCLGHVFL